MKKLIIAFLLPLTAFAQQQLKSKATLVSATVYNNGAELNHTGNAQLPAGASTLTISNISGQINQNSIQVGISAGVTILSVQFNRDFLNADVADPAITKLNDSLKIISDELEKTKNYKAVEEQTLLLLDENRKSGGTTMGTNVAELTKLTEYYRSKNIQVRNAIAGFTKTEEKLNQKYLALQQQINELKSNPNQQLGQIVLQVIANENTFAKYSLSYTTPNANWVAGYDIKAINTSNPLTIVYKAEITQRSGLDWKNIKLALSTGSPNYNITAPILNPWFVSANGIQHTLMGRIPGTEIRKKNSLSEVVVSGYGSAKLKQATVDDYTTVNESQLGVTFNIDIPYDIKSDNKPHTIAFKEYSIPAQYKYYAVPKLSSEAYLLANITNWEKLNLQAGDANIIFENTYTGKTYINPKNLLDTLSLSMGKDKKIFISKEKQADFSSTKFIGSNKKQTFTYLITIRNTKRESIALNVKDQYPISTESDVEVELLENNGAETNKETGMLNWQLKLAPNETKILKLSYSIKAPKNKIVSGL